MWMQVASAPVAAVESDDEPEILARDEDYAAGKLAINNKQWAAALARLERAERRHPESADLHNMMGYARRHLKLFEAAFISYKRALDLDPRHRGAHEYIGEAYLMMGDLANAEKHLAALRGICLLPCEELEDLQKAVAEFRAKAR